nr:methyltransferase domain-containing protein [Calditrichia bacterium]NIV71524.1 methyltransferase domain-containing protein [Calditrichia bacterium]NIV98084.1 methyltransferase domain-containing protein [Candidatus Saccharibacteria bacterium]NIW80687.1 methyltransferase domain-containing protein [Calditrichia bacterium]
MSCCQCQGIEQEFNEKYVKRDLKKYCKKGPQKTTRLLLEALKSERIAGGMLLDIGGGVGAIQHELLAAGMSRAISVEASSAYLTAAREEAERLGLTGKIEFKQGNFVNLAEEILQVDIVTLDRVICCFDEMTALVGRSAERAGKFYGVV